MLSSISSIENNLIQSITSQYVQLPMEIYEKVQDLFTTDLCVNEKIVQIPVRSKKCADHQKWSFDLLDVYHQSEQKILRCRICDVEFTQQDIILDNYWYSFIKQFNKQCQYIVILKDFCFQKVFRQIKYIKQLENNQDLIYSLWKKRDHQYNFSKIIEQDQFINGQLIEQNYSAICLQDHVKLCIPVRFKDCKHIGAYELTSLLCKFNEVIEKNKTEKEKQQIYNFNEQKFAQIKKFYQCRQLDCKVRINYDYNELRQNLVLDYELLQAIKISHPCTINFKIHNNQGNIKFEGEYSDEKNQFIINIWRKLPKEAQNLYPSPQTHKIRFLNCYQEFFHEILNTFQRIFSNQDESKVIKKILQPYKYQTHHISLFDPIADMVIEYPARCMECQDIRKCLDLRSLISVLSNQKRQDPEKLGLNCSICNFTHMPNKKKKDININQILYLDNQLLAQMMSDHSYRNVQNNILYYDGKKILLEEFKRHQILTIDQTIDISRCSYGIIQYKSMKCNGNLLKDPLVVVKCPENSRFSFDHVYEVLKNSGFNQNNLKLCDCFVCNVQDLNIWDLYYDELLAKIIPQLPKNYDINESICYDTQKSQFFKKQWVFQKINS